jgi:hypothetical protein
VGRVLKLAPKFKGDAERRTLIDALKMITEELENKHNMF